MSQFFGPNSLLMEQQMLDPKNPETWQHLQEHPSFALYGFTEEWQEWYGSDNPDGELAILKNIATLLLQKFSHATVELVVLDDVTTYVTLTIDKLAGYFGRGCDPGTCYLHIDPDTSVMNSLETEVDNLFTDELINMVVTYAAMRPAIENE